MSRTDPLLKTVLSEIAKTDDRSPLFWWMVDHHDEVIAAASGRRMRWGRLCVRFAELGLTDRTGKPATMAGARLTWFRARQEVARIRGLTAPPASRPGSVYPSRIPKDWRPTAVQQSGPGPIPATPAAPSSFVSPQGYALRPPPPKGPGMSIMEKLTGVPDAIRKDVSDVRPAGGERDVDAEIARLRQELASRRGG